MAVLAKYDNLFITFMHMQSKVERNNRNEFPVTSTYTAYKFDLPYASEMKAIL